MIVRILIGGLTLAIVASASARTWDPRTAVADAERDIASGKVRFCYIGGYVTHAPGVPETGRENVSRYPHLAVGPQGCRLDQHAAVSAEYAIQYNGRMWEHVSRMQHGSSNQSMQLTPHRRTASLWMINTRALQAKLALMSGS